MADGAPFRIHRRSLNRGGDPAITATIRQMQALVYGVGGVLSGQIRQAALEAVRGVERGQGEIESVFNYVKDRIEFRGEYEETLQEPRVTLQLGAGDCDDHSTLLAALLQSLGFRTRFKTIATPRSQGDFSHVYVEVEDKRSKQWVPLDTTVESASAGWEAPDATRSQSYRTMGPNERVTPGMFLLVAGLGLAFGILSGQGKR
jgi:hypothetical protein